MSSWNVIPRCDLEEPSRPVPFMLMNRSNTLVRFSPKANFDLLPLLVRMEELDVPFAYTEELKEIYFTRCLVPRRYGDYLNFRICLACDRASLQCIDRTLIHELGHHLDEQEDLSGDERIAKESRPCKDLGEWIAQCFETFYMGSVDQKATFRRSNPQLHGVIRHLHKRYQNH